MPDQTNARRGSLFLPLIIMVLGVLFLLSNIFPGLEVRQVFRTWWPLLLVAVGLGKIWDHVRLRNDPNAAPIMGISGWGVVLLIVICMIGFGMSRGSRGRDVRGSHNVSTSHNAESIERHGNESVRVAIEFGAGELQLNGGSAKLLQADFDTDGEAPHVAYNVSGSEGRLSIKQRDTGPHFGNADERWNLRFQSGVPMEIKIDMGAGECRLEPAGLDLSQLEVHMGAGELNLDLRDDWKRDMSVSVEGGAGSATVRLPKGVRVEASGGIGSINVTGLEHRGGAYVNSLYGKSPVTLRVSVHGGVGEINLIAEK